MVFLSLVLTKTKTQAETAGDTQSSNVNFRSRII